MKSKKLPDFSGKVILITLLGPGRYTHTLTETHWENINGKLFLVGTVPSRGSQDDWCLGIVSGIAWEQVSEFLIFDSIKQYHKHIGTFDQKKRKT